MITEGGGEGWSGLKVIQKIVSFSFPSAEGHTGSHACQAGVLPPSYSPTPSHIRETQLPAPTVGHGTRDCLQSEVGVGSCPCSDFPASQLPFPEVIPQAHPQGCLPASLMNFSLLSRVQSFLQVLTATLIFSPFCNRSVCSGTLVLSRGILAPASAWPSQT